MRNNYDEDDWSSVGTITTTESSFVNVPNEIPDQQPTLAMQATAQNSTVGFFSNQKTMKVCVTIKAMVDELADASRSPVDLIAVLDKSSSMAGDKLNDCKATMDHVCKNLTSKDRLGLVSFSNNAVLEVPACYMTPENKERLKLKTKAIQAGGGTNLSGGLSMAAMEMAQTEKPNQIRSIFLLTDGYANSGIRDTGDLITMVQNINSQELLPINELSMGGEGNSEKNAGVPLGNHHHHQVPPRIAVPNKKPISLFCFGYGGSHNSDMLRSISDATPGGAYYFVERDSDVSTAFGDAMGGLLSVVGQSAYVHISVPPEAKLQGVKILKVHHKDAIKRSDTAYTVNVGDFYAEESRDVLFEMQLSTNAPNTDPVPHVRTTLNYMDTVQKKATTVGPVECCIQRPPNNEVSTPNEHVGIQWLRIQTAHAIQDADSQARGNNLSGARSRLQSAISLITTSPVYSDDSPMIYAMQTDVQDVLNGFRSAEQYRRVGTHSAANKGACMAKQRCMESRASKFNVFRGSKKAKMAKDFKQTKQTLEEHLRNKNTK